MVSHRNKPLNVVHFIAQGAINIAEGQTTIEPGSRIHVAMERLCSVLNEWQATPGYRSVIVKLAAGDPAERSTAWLLRVLDQQEDV